MFFPRRHAGVPEELGNKLEELYVCPIVGS